MSKELTELLREIINEDFIEGMDKIDLERAKFLGLNEAYNEAVDVLMNLSSRLGKIKDYCIYSGQTKLVKKIDTLFTQIQSLLGKYQPLISKEVYFIIPQTRTLAKGYLDKSSRRLESTDKHVIRTKNRNYYYVDYYWSTKATAIQCLESWIKELEEDQFEI